MIIIFFKKVFTNFVPYAIIISEIRIILKLRLVMSYNSRKRNAILEALEATVEHPTAETLYEVLKPDYPELSLGTVYRNLSVLKEEGLIIGVGTVDGHERFDARTDLHAHLICSRCGKTSDLELSSNFIAELLALPNDCGFSASSARLNFSGLCNACSQNGF